MANAQSAHGQCLCGNVKVTVKQASTQMEVCHCNMCQTWSGGPLLAVNCGVDVEFEGRSAIQVYESSDWAERGFCQHCGTHLFYRLKHNNQTIIPAGLLKTKQGLSMHEELFIEQKPTYYDFANPSTKLTGKQLFERFGA